MKKREREREREREWEDTNSVVTSKNLIGKRIAKWCGIFSENFTQQELLA